ncbi:serine/threonine-protein phosphatase 7 long form homolog [Gossypium arboreum]|uniref:serine/threonine-protein phosphatase 7 long form homolog n=1 Tax=Gossypium arboreum TaxID=29729 RepID=UPI0022F14AB7|nr:serine/threonine-protein phosphatase 7 long form homolog [Gossypium arboreum]
MPFLASISHQSYIFPLINRWSTNLGIRRSYTVSIYHLIIENHAGEGFVWMSYSVPKIMTVIPSSAHVHSNLWCISTPVINFHIVEWYHGDRVLRQFGCIQYITTLPVQLEDIHGMSRRRAYGNDWGELHEEYIMMWNNRLGRVPQMDHALDLQPLLEYI